MSRIGKKPVPIPSGVEVKVEGRNVCVKGPKGVLTQEVTGALKVEVDAAAKEVRVKRESDVRADRAKHGLYRALIANMVEGVTKGYAKSLEIQGVGYRVIKQGSNLQLFVGYNNKVPVMFEIPKGVEVACPTPTEINISGTDKQLVGQVAAAIRHIRPPDVYKGKGIRYKGEVVRKLPGKTVAATGSTA
ncbi:MAG: 50S ribosomal protein L6 [Planctomycetota bacterium]|nr:50S ribosomal protein L6 [Planctomycetota bacterium]